MTDQLFNDRLTTELLRVCAQGYKFTLPNGEVIHGATESEVIKHLTSSRDYVSGREFRFPGIGNGWVFDDAVKAVGFRIVSAKNFRNQTCRIVTL